MANPTYPLVNAHRYSYASIELNLGSAGIFVGVKEISYSDSLEPGVVRGTRAEKLGRTKGEYEPEASITLWKEDAVELIKKLGNGFMEKSFDITVTYAEENAPTTVDKIIGCRIKSNENSHSQGTDALEHAFELDVMRIEWGGVQPLVNQLV